MRTAQLTHGFGEVERNFLIDSAAEAYENFMRLLEYDRVESLTRLLTMIGDAIVEAAARKSEPSEDDEEDVETQSAKRRRYNDCDQGEASDPDYWAELHYGPPHGEESQDGDMLEC